MPSIIGGCGQTRAKITAITARAKIEAKCCHCI